MSFWRHAFAIPTPPPVCDDDRHLLSALAREIARRGLTTPAIFLFEMSRPLGFLGAQALHFLAPVITAVVPRSKLAQVTKLLERRDIADLLIAALEHPGSAPPALPASEALASGSPAAASCAPDG